MASYTTNLGLIKPDQTDQASITPINDNSDILDEKVGALWSGAIIVTSFDEATGTLVTVSTDNL